MMELNLYQKVLIGLIIILSFYLVVRKREDKFASEYFDLVNSDKYKVKGNY